jgi:hypothetical protein
MIIFIDIFHLRLQIESIKLMRTAMEVAAGDESFFLIANNVPTLSSYLP